MTTLEPTDHLEAKCDGRHEHQAVLGSARDQTGKARIISKHVQRYPPGYVKALVKAVCKQCHGKTDRAEAAIDEIIHHDGETRASRPMTRTVEPEKAGK